jgi:predicted RNA-binding Zn ribbon-like protein
MVLSLPAKTDGHLIGGNLAPNPNSRPPAVFTGDHLALDFVNSRSTPHGVWTEWLRDGTDLLDWLEEAGAIDGVDATRFREDTGAREALDEVTERARTLREWLRGFVARHAGREIGTEAAGELGPLNDLLARSDCFWQVEAGGNSVEASATDQRPLCLQRVRRWTTPQQLLQPLAEAIADLVCNEDFRLIRACEGKACVLFFLDKTKSHARRWCSMAICGNRAKAAAHRARASRKHKSR